MTRLCSYHETAGLGRAGWPRGDRLILDEAHGLSPGCLHDRIRTLVETATRALSPLPPPDGLRTPTERGERITAKQAAAILGLKPRKLQAMSARGEIPGAAKLGRQWTYDLAKLRRFVEQREQACQNEKPRPDATGATKSFGAKSRLKGSASGGRLGQMIQQSQKRAARRAKRGR